MSSSSRGHGLGGLRQGGEHVIAVYGQERHVIDAVEALRREGFQPGQIDIVALDQGLEAELRAQTRASGVSAPLSRGRSAGIANALMELGISKVEAREIEVLIERGQVLINIEAGERSQETKAMLSALPGTPTTTSDY